ncbi:MAG: hypothetical protein J7599_14915 [Niabella sp.]|nr:hypothetical protein [Niabella sp.]
MAIYDLAGLVTIADCDAALKTVSKTITKLERKKMHLEHRMEVHQEVVSKAAAALSSLHLELSFLNNKLSWTREGIQTQQCQYKITRTQCRIQFQELRLATYSKPALLMKKFHLNQAVAALELATRFKTALEARRTELLKTDNDDALRSGTPADAEPAVMLPLIPVQQPVAGPEPLKTPKPVVRLFQKRMEKRWESQAVHEAGRINKLHKTREA